MNLTKYILLNRNGYGSNFNEIYIDYANNIIKKKCNNDYGLKKINYEIKIYKFIIENKIDFPIPKIYSIEDNGYTMHFFVSHMPLYKIYNSLTQPNIILNKIYILLEKLHKCQKKTITQDEYYSNLNLEIYSKIIERYSMIQPIINKYYFIKKVNNIEIIPFFQLIEKIKTEIFKIVEKKTDYYLVPIHGDCQFNNILYNVENNDIVFIDPRGYYGDYEIFGIEEYDMAKINFALSGYDEFDNRDIDYLIIKGDNIEIIINAFDKKILQKKSLDILLMLTIWLGNSHCFINTEKKAVYSYYIAMYLGSLYFNHVDPVI